MSHYTEKEIDCIIKNYSTYSAQEIQTNFLNNRSIDSIKWQIKKIKQSGIKLFPISRKRKYNYNHDFFALPDNNNSYWAGFIGADGCIRTLKTSKYLQISLSSKDESHLVKFASDIRYDGKIKRRSYSKKDIRFKQSYYNYSIINICSKKICEDLFQNYNIVSNKSLILKPPNLSYNNSICYIKGYFDGDGHITYNFNNPNTRLQIGLAGTGEMLEWIRDTLSNYNKSILNKNINKRGNIYTLILTGKLGLNILKYLYFSINTPFLERKKQKTQQIINLGKIQ